MKSDRRITMNDLNREVLQHNKLPDLVLDKLMEWIMSGKLSMGDKLNTEELASQLGVSRMPIRSQKKRYRIWKRFKKNIRGSCRRIQLMRLMYTSRTDCIISQFTKRVS